jgi:hypothetical protein
MFESLTGGMVERESNEIFEKFAETFEIIESTSNCSDIIVEHRKIIKIVSMSSTTFD